MLRPQSILVFSELKALRCLSHASQPNAMASANTSYDLELVGPSMLRLLRGSSAYAIDLPSVLEVRALRRICCLFESLF